MVRERSNELPGFRERSGIKITSEKRAQYGRGRVRSGGRERGLERVCSREGTRGHDVRRGEEGAIPGEGRGRRRPSSQEGNRPKACEPTGPELAAGATDGPRSMGQRAIGGTGSGDGRGHRLFLRSVASRNGRGGGGRRQEGKSRLTFF